MPTKIVCCYLPHINPIKWEYAEQMEFAMYEISHLGKVLKLPLCLKGLNS